MWKPEHRLAADRRGLRYPSDLTDAEWGIAAPMDLRVLRACGRIAANSFEHRLGRLIAMAFNFPDRTMPSLEGSVSIAAAATLRHVGQLEGSSLFQLPGEMREPRLG
jgi:hypothetical protein